MLLGDRVARGATPLIAGGRLPLRFLAHVPCQRGQMGNILIFKSESRVKRAKKTGRLIVWA